MNLTCTRYTHEPGMYRYKSVESLCTSDHKPVRASFLVKMNQKPARVSLKEVSREIS